MAAIAHLQMAMAPAATPQICHLLPLLSTILRPHHMAETWAVEALIQTAVPRRKINQAVSQAMPQHGNVWVPPHLLIATNIMMKVSAAYMTVHLLLVNTVMALILIVQGAALHHMQAGKAKAAVVVAVAIAGACTAQPMPLIQSVPVKLR